MPDDRLDTLVTPPGWHLDPRSLDQLRARLTSTPPEVVGVRASMAELPPGASYRVVAERAALLAGHPAVEVGAAPGPALLRHDTDHAVEGETVVADGLMLQDPAAAALGPASVDPTLLPAVAESVSPFPWRPVAVCLGLGSEVDRLDAAMGLALALLDHDVEGRLAVPAAPSVRGPLRPCVASRSSLLALRADVVLAIDSEGLEVAQQWSPARHTTVIDACGAGTGVELVSWRLGEEQGRLRARIGLAAEPGQVADLVRRLVTGPQPVPPTDVEVAIR